jgi:hypothetical protein
LFNFKNVKKMKKIIFTIVMAISAIVVSAQTAVQTSKILDNTYVGIEAGVATPFTKPKAWFPVNTLVGLHVGKQFSPVWGAEVEGTTWFGSHQVMRHANRFDGHNHCFVRGHYLGVNGTVNLTNLFIGYNGSPRFFEVSTVLGTGWEHAYIPNNNDYNGLAVKTGLDLAFNLGESKAHSVSIRPAVLWDVNQPECKSYESFNRRNAELYVGVAYTYHFKTSNGTHYFKVYDIGAMIDKINSFKAELAKKPTQVTKEVVKVINKEYEGGFGVNETVYFAFDSDELDERAKETLDKLGQNGVYVIDAYASSEGTTEYNLELSQRRANAVKAYIEGRGAKVDSAVGHGVQFGTTTGRVATVKLK